MNIGIGEPFPESARLLLAKTEHSLTVVPLIPASFDCSWRLPNGQAIAGDASRGLPFGRLAATAGSSTAIHTPKEPKLVAGWPISLAKR